MENIFESLKNMISPEIISKISTYLGEDTSKVSNAIKSAIPSIFGGILEKGKDSQVENVLKEAGHSSVLSNLSGIFSGSADSEVKNIGSKFMHAVFGDKTSSFSSLISSHSGLGQESTNKLLGILAPALAGFLGGKLTSQTGYADLLNQIKSEKGSFLSNIPSGLSNILGISSLSALGSSTVENAKEKLGNIKDKAEQWTEKTKDKTQNEYNTHKNKKEGSGWGWLKWLIIILLIVLLFYWLFSKNSCSHNKNPNEVKVTQESEQVTTNTPNSDSIKVENGRKTVTLNLPSGKKINVYENGTEDQIFKFLESDEYKNATEDQLKDKWFNFDGIIFEFGSEDKLAPESQAQLKNLITILREFPDAKIKIGAYTDKTGSDPVNLRLSEQRANTIKQALETNGLKNQVIGAEGYGSEFAQASPNAPDSEREKDRKIALRFVK